MMLGLALALLAAVAPAAQEPGEEIVLRVMTHERWFAGWEYMEAATREFEAEHPGVRVELISSAGGGGSRDKVKFALAGDIPIDVTWIDVTEFSAFLDEGVLVDLQPYFDAAAAERGPDGAPQFDEADYWPQILNGMRGPNGHLYGLPSTFTPYVMYVNKSLLAREGLAMPSDDWTWQQMESMARQVNARPGRRRRAGSVRAVAHAVAAGDLAVDLAERRAAGR